MKTVIILSDKQGTGGTKFMGFSMRKIPFMIVDDSPIEIESASCMKWFKFSKLSDFQSIRGGFSETDKNPKTYIFERGKPGTQDYQFAEFKFKQ